MNRRAFIATAAGLVATPRAVRGQGPAPRRIAVVFGRSPLVTMEGAQPAVPTLRAFLEGLRDLGYVEGRNIVIERRALEGRLDQVPAVVADLLRLKVEVILAAARDVAIAVQRITTTVPIVVVDATYEGPNRMVESLARPGGNVTGLAGVVGGGVTQKMLELLKEALPQISRVSALTEPLDTRESDEVTGVEATARRLQLRLSWIETKSLDDVPAALQAAARQRPDALLVLGSSTFFARRRDIAAFALKQRLPTMCGYREFVDEGALMSYTDPLPERFRRAATYVDKLLKGANPATLPIELPTKFELRVNARTAKALGVTISPSLLVRADEVIQ